MTDFDMESMDDGQRIIAMMLAHARVNQNTQIESCDEQKPLDSAPEK